MNNFLDNNRLYPLLGWTFLGLFLLLLVLEGWRYGVKPSKVNNEQLIEEKLTEASSHFLHKQQELLNQTEDLAAMLHRPLLQKRSSQYLHNTLGEFPPFWGTELYQGNQPIAWRGFTPQNSTEREFSTLPEQNDVSIRRENNIVYWEFHVPFSIQDSAGTTNYDLFTSHRIEQSNPLPIGDRNEYDIFDTEEFSSSYPLNFNIFSSPPQQYSQAQQLSNLQGDSVGVVYATADKFQRTQEQWAQSTRFWRSVFALLCFVILAGLFFWIADKLPLWRSLALQMFFIIIGWGILAYTNMLTYWILTLDDITSGEWSANIESLSTTCTNAFFALVTSITLARKLNRFRPKVSPSWYLSSLGFAGLTGVINAISVLVGFNLLYQASISANVPLLDLRIIPQGGTIILYLSIGMAILALGIFLTAINRLLLRATSEHFKVTASMLGASFLLGLFVFHLVMPNSLTLNRVFYTGVFGFAVITGYSIAYSQNIRWISRISPLRKIVIGSFVIAGLSLPTIYQASLVEMDEKLMETAQSYSQETDPVAADLTKEMLTSLEKNFRDINKEDLVNNQSTLQSRFTETIQNLLSPELGVYSFDLQLINTSGELIADYSTDLNSPNWLNFYNISTLKAVTDIEQITKSTIRPIVQQPQLINQQDYSTFHRGWIPIFGESENTPIAWILCSIYQERPEFNKPIRAVLASLTYEDWNNSYLMQKYQDGQLINSVQRGFTGYFAQDRTLTPGQLEALENDSLIYINEQASDYNYRSLLWKISEKTIIKISTTLSDYRVILFTFFRISFILLLIGCLLMLLAQLLTWGRVSFLGKNKRFQARILDSFLLATLIFLTLLIATSHYAIKQQNQEIVRQELFDKLESLSSTVASDRQIAQSPNMSRSFSLETLVTPLNVDASFYEGRSLSETTTPQIYQQHLLPSVLPYDIYHQLFVQRQKDAFSTVNLAGQSLLIGYRSISNEENQPVAAIAIPTFLESPKYDQQLLQTTSYLILIYLLVFGLFIIGSTIIAQRLTRPLVYIQRGLNKISAGNLDTTIPVTSKDEIGNLAEAYNNMVNRLKKLQKDLAAAEREAAWKEMAQQVAHEIKNPLTPMKLNVQHLERQLKSDTQDPEELKEHVQKITQNLIEQIQSLSNIASDFSKFSQPLGEDFKTINLANTLSSVAKLYEQDEKVSVKFHTQPQSIYVRGIADELKRVMINLVKNAYEAMPEEGGKIILRLYRKQQNVFVEVEDNGTGIPEEARSNIFVPNFSTKSSGTGLGLAICKKIIEAHEGSISFASVEGEGTTFVIKLPHAKGSVED